MYRPSRDVLLLLIHHHFSAGSTSSTDPPLGLEISQYLRTTILDHDYSISLILVAEWLEVLLLKSRLVPSNFVAHLYLCSDTFLRDERLKFLILTSIVSAVIPYGRILSPEMEAGLRAWWITHLVFVDHDIDIISQCLCQSFYEDRDQINVPAIITSSVNIRSALGFALAERQHYRQAQSVLSACLSDTSNSWPADSPTRHFLLAEFLNCSNLLGDQAQAESAARQTMQRPWIGNRFDVVCLKIALADSYICQGKYNMAMEVLTEIPRDSSLSIDVQLRVGLRLTKVEQRLAKEGAIPMVNTKFVEQFVDAKKNITESLRRECLEETLSVVVEAGQQLTNAFTVEKLNKVIEGYLGCTSNNWRVEAIRKALKPKPPDPLNNSDEDDQQPPYDSSQGWGKSVLEPGIYIEGQEGDIYTILNNQSIYYLSGHGLRDDGKEVRRMKPLPSSPTIESRFLRAATTLTSKINPFKRNRKRKKIIYPWHRRKMLPRREPAELDGRSVAYRMSPQPR